MRRRGAIGERQGGSLLNIVGDVDNGVVYEAVRLSTGMLGLPAEMRFREEPDRAY
jgi:hypothetical protein